MKKTFAIVLAVLLAGCGMPPARALVIDTENATLAELLAARDAVAAAIEAAQAKEAQPVRTAAPGEFDHSRFAALQWYEVDAYKNWRFSNYAHMDVKGGYVRLGAELRGVGGAINATPWFAIQTHINDENLQLTSLTVTAGGDRYRFAPMEWSGTSMRLKLGNLGREMLGRLARAETVKIRYANAETGFTRTVTYTAAELKGILDWAAGLEETGAWDSCDPAVLAENDLYCLAD